jgi:hypothetical protein
MRALFTTLLIITCLNVSGQTSDTKIYKVTTYMGGQLYSVKMDTVKGPQKLSGLYFFYHHFGAPMALPPSFKDTNHRNEKVVIPPDEPSDTNDHQVHGRNRPQVYYTYDDSSRVILFGKTGCTVCSFIPYEYTVSYNKAGLVETISSSKNSWPPNNAYHVYYNHAGEIKQLDYIESADFKKEIILVN